jgi:transposase
MKDTIKMKYNDFVIGWQVEKLRLKMVRYAFKYGISASAREFRVTRKTVRKWVRRYDGSKKSLSDRSRCPIISPNRMPMEIEKAIVAYRERFPTFGARRIEDELKIPYSHVAVHRVLKQNGLVKEHRKKWRRKRDMRAVKAKMRPFEKLQVDVKYLDDIPEFYPALIRYRLPRFEYTARDVRTGFTFISFGNEFSQTNSVNFLIYLVDRLTALGVNPKECTIQTDNGGEFTSSWNSGKRSACEKFVDAYFAGYSNIPPGASTYQSDVETFHRLIEDEFYRIEPVESFREFFGKAATYIIWFNWARRNRYKNGSPAEIWATTCLKGGPPSPTSYVFPILLDRITPYILKQGGYHVPLPDRYVLITCCPIVGNKLY